MDFHGALAWHSAQLAAAAGQAVTYKRGATSIAVPDAVEGKTEFETEDGDFSRVRGSQTDWIVRRTRITAIYPPAPGDIIETATDQFEVQNLGAEPCFRRMHSDNLVRIHVRYIGPV